MTPIQQAGTSSDLYGTNLGSDINFQESFDANGDPVEAYFECISQCSLDDGECVTVCTTILREQG